VVADGDVKATSALLKVIDRVDRYQQAAKVNEVFDDEARKKLIDKINRVAASASTSRRWRGELRALIRGRRTRKKKMPLGVGANL
jgi:hypothetical protein